MLKKIKVLIERRNSMKYYKSCNEILEIINISGLQPIKPNEEIKQDLIRFYYAFKNFKGRERFVPDIAGDDIGLYHTFEYILAAYIDLKNQDYYSATEKLSHISFDLAFSDRYYYNILHILERGLINEKV